MGQRGDRIGANSIIYRGDGQTILQRLTDQHAIERVTVDLRKIGKMRYTGFIEG
jgi:hypothetical protein